MENNGIIVLNKPREMSSFLAVKLVQKAVGAKKAGHMGTLDPLADGVLLVGVNKGTKLFDHFLTCDKTYRTVFKFGEETDTLDTEGEVIAANDVKVTREMLEETLGAFVGKYPQMPPRYSAKKIDGKKACDLARKGVEFELKPKNIEVYDLKLLGEIAENTFEFEIHCSSGFYVRSLARDLAKTLGTYAHALSITRIKCGNFSINQAQTLDDLRNGKAVVYEVGYNQVKFGPSGNSPGFYLDGYKSSLDAPKWIRSIGLDAYEYSFGRGYTMGMDTAKTLGKRAEKYGITMSIHAPYYINFANPDEEMKEKSFEYILKGLEYLKAMNGNHFVFHIASQGKLKRDEALALTKQRLEEFLQRFDLSEYKGISLCPETMGKYLQIGSYKEIIDLCTYSEILVPTFDFGHINCTMQGNLKTTEDYLEIFNYSIEKLGYERTKNCHIHFSKIEFGEKGEIRHKNYEDEGYGPEFPPLASAIKALGLSPTIICESHEYMAEDALVLKNIYENT